MARLPRLKGIDLHARFGGILEYQTGLHTWPVIKISADRDGARCSRGSKPRAGRKSAKRLDAGQCRAATAGTYVAGAVLFRCPGPPLPSISSRRPNVKQGAVASHVVLDPLPAGFFAAPSSPPFNYPKHMVMTFGGRPQEGPMQGAGRLSRTARSCSATSRRAADVAKLPTWPLAVQECSDSLRSKERAFGVGAVNDGLAATSARGRLPPQGNRKAGTGPGGRNGEVVENMETKTRKRRLPKD